MTLVNMTHEIKKIKGDLLFFGFRKVSFYKSEITTEDIIGLSHDHVSEYSVGSDQIVTNLFLMKALSDND